MQSEDFARRKCKSEMWMWSAMEGTPGGTLAPAFGRPGASHGLGPPVPELEVEARSRTMLALLEEKLSALEQLLRSSLEGNRRRLYAA